MVWVRGQAVPIEAQYIFHSVVNVCATLCGLAYRLALEVKASVKLIEFAKPVLMVGAFSVAHG